MKITRSTTVAQLKDFLGANFKAVKKQDKTLADSITYASEQAKKDPKSVKKADLVDLAKQVISLLGDKVTDATAPKLVPVAENSVKPKLPASKGDKKTPEKKKEEVKIHPSSAGDSSKSVQLAEAFPAELTVGETVYEQATDIKNMEDLYDAMSNSEDGDILFAYYWTKRHLKQFDYFGRWLGQPKEFDSDLDLAIPLYVSDEKKVAYQISTYTEAIYTILPSDLEEEDGVRVSSGIEYQIYRAKK